MECVNSSFDVLLYVGRSTNYMCILIFFINKILNFYSTNTLYKYTIIGKNIYLIDLLFLLTHGTKDRI